MQRTQRSLFSSVLASHNTVNISFLSPVLQPVNVLLCFFSCFPFLPLGSQSAAFPAQNRARHFPLGPRPLLAASWPQQLAGTRNGTSNLFNLPAMTGTSRCLGKKSLKYSCDPSPPAFTSHSRQGGFPTTQQAWLRRLSQTMVEEGASDISCAASVLWC